jgi:hypothetical protein
VNLRSNGDRVVNRTVLALFHKQLRKRVSTVIIRPSSVRYTEELHYYCNIATSDMCCHCHGTDWLTYSCALYTDGTMRLHYYQPPHNNCSLLHVSANQHSRQQGVTVHRRAQRAVGQCMVTCTLTVSRQQWSLYSAGNFVWFKLCDSI